MRLEDRVSHPKAFPKVTRSRLYWLSLAILAIGALLVAHIESSKTASGATQRIAVLEKSVKCPSCFGISVYDAHSAAAFSIKTYITNEVGANVSDAVILDNLVASYGTSVLMSPPTSGLSAILWFSPLILGAVVVYELFRSSRRRSPELRASLLRAPGSQAPSPSSNSFALSEVENPSVGIRSWVLVNPKGRRVTLVAGLSSLVGAALLAAFTLFSPTSPTTSSQGMSPVKAALLVDQGKKYALLGEEVLALREFSKVLRSNPHQPDALTYQGWLLYQAGVKDHSAALRYQGLIFLSEAVRLAPRYPDAHLFYGLALYGTDRDLQTSLAQLKEFFKEKPPQSLVSAASNQISAVYRAAGEQVPAIG